MRARQLASRRCRPRPRLRSKASSRFPDLPMARFEWLTARPIAHRGLHDASSGVIENTGAAFSAAIAAGYGIETDLQISADAEAMVHHDDALGRLTEASGRRAGMRSAEVELGRFRVGTWDLR